MKEQLELKHLAPYLPYGLKAQLSDEGRFNLDSEYPNEHQFKSGLITEFSISSCGDIYGEFQVSDNYYFSFNKLSEIKPILRPLSDLTKEIEHNGERFVPKELLREVSGAFKPTDDIKNTFNICIVDGTVTRFSALCVHVNQLELFQKLHEYHFDVFGLIDKGLAISYEEAGL